VAEQKNRVHFRGVSVVVGDDEVRTLAGVSFGRNLVANDRQPSPVKCFARRPVRFESAGAIGSPRSKSLAALLSQRAECR